MTAGSRPRLASVLLLAVVLLGLLPGDATAVEPPRWQVESVSLLGFVARQAGAAIEGRFDRFDAEIVFDPDNLDGSHVAVGIDMNSVNTQSGERDQVIRSADLFDVASWPRARFEATRFEPDGKDGYIAHGRLTLRDVTQDVALPFDLTIAQHPDDSGALQARVVGALPLLRLDYGVGQGQWRDTATVANEVVVRIEILAKRAKEPGSN